MAKQTDGKWTSLHEDRRIINLKMCIPDWEINRELDNVLYPSKLCRY